MALAKIDSYSPAWPGEFRQVAAAIRGALGPRAVRIDHIGSTSVPGMPAKDIIDVQVAVTALDPEVVAALRAAGFELRPFDHDHRPPGVDGPPDDWAKRLLVEPPGQRRVNVHIRVEGNPNQRYALLFRDYLRTHPEAATAYGAFKRGLAGLSLETGVYADIKDPVCDLIMVSAEEWANRTGWRPGSPDA